VLVLAAIGLAVLLSFTRQNTVKVHEVTVQRGSIRSLVSTNGKIEPIENLEAHAPIPTTVKRVLVKEGDHVRKGELLVQLDDADLVSKAAQAQVQMKAAAASEAALETGGTQEQVLALEALLRNDRNAVDVAERKLEALRKLEQQGAASPGEVTVAEENLKAAQSDLTLSEQKRKDPYSQPEINKVHAEAAEAQAAYAAAEDDLAKCNVRAAFDGEVYSLPVKQGDFVEAGALLLQEADLSKVLLRAYVDEPDIGRLQPGQRVEITWDALPNRTWSGTLNSVPSVVKQHSARNVGEVTCAIDNQDLKLLPNDNVGVTIIVAQLDNVLTLERDALRLDDGQPYVYRIVNDHLKRQPVEIALQNLTQVQIAGGLPQGAQVALPAEENRPLVDGAAVKVVP
jgi:HlyD family secretion protein